MSMQIKNFSGMGNKGMYYLEGMSKRTIQGQDILTPSWYASNFLSEDTAGFANIASILGMTQFDIKTTKDFMACIDTGGKIYVWTNTTKYGEAHDTSDTASAKPDIFTTTNNNLLYTSAEFLGKGYTGKCTSASATSFVDTAKDFTGIVSGDKVYDLTLGQEFVVTSVSTNTINVTAVAGKVPSTNDLFIAFDDNFQDLGASDPDYIRQIKYDGVNYYIGNNNYLASLNNDETTFLATTKQLPVGYEFQCSDSNQEKWLIGAKINNKGALLLWDGTTDGWIRILQTDKPPISIQAYNSGWIVIMGARIYYTDGYTMQLIDRYPDTDKFNSNFIS